MLGTEAEVGAEDVEDLGPLTEGGVGLGVTGIDGDDMGTALEQRIGRGEAADTEPGDEHAQPGPVGVAVGQVGHAGARTGR